MHGPRPPRSLPPTPRSAIDCGCSLVPREVGRLHSCRAVVGLISARDALPSGERSIRIQSLAHHARTTRLRGRLCKEKGRSEVAREVASLCTAVAFLLPRVAMCRSSAARRLQRISLSSHGDLYDNLPGITAQPVRVTEGRRGRVWGGEGVKKIDG